jgi:hypothetical protein
LPDIPRFLLDECLPKKLKREFADCIVSTKAQNQEERKRHNRKKRYLARYETAEGRV